MEFRAFMFIKEYGFLKFKLLSLLLLSTSSKILIIVSCYRRRPNRRGRPFRNRNKNEDSERVPFLVPLMMVPESEVGVDKPFSFSGGEKPNHDFPTYDPLHQKVQNPGFNRYVNTK